MPPVPSLVQDTVSYDFRNHYADQNLKLTLLNGSVLDIWGTVFVNGNPLALIGSLPIATQAEAEAGVDNSKVMTPLRVKQAVIVQALPAVTATSPGGTATFLRADGTWATPPGAGGVVDGDKGDIIVSASGATWMFDPTIVTAAAKTLLDDVSIAAMRSTLDVAGYAASGFSTTGPGQADRFIISGSLTPAANNHATSKSYVDSQLATALGLYLPTAGGTLTGSLVLQAPAQLQGSADLALTTVGPGNLLKLMTNGSTRVFVGDTAISVTKPFYLAADPIDPTEAATKQYIDAVVALFTSTTKGTVPASGGGTTNFLRADGTWAVPSGSGGGSLTDGDKTDITVSGAGAIWTIDNSVVTNAKMANMVASTIKGRGAGSTGAPQDLTPAQARTILASDSGGGTTNFFAADGTWATPAGGGAGVTDGDKGDIVVSASGATWMFDSGVVTPAAKTILDDTSIAAIKTTLGLDLVSNTADSSKPVSTAQAAADALRVLKSGDTMTGDLIGTTFVADGIQAKSYLQMKGNGNIIYWTDAGGATIYSTIQGTSQGWFFDIGNNGIDFQFTDTGIISGLTVQAPTVLLTAAPSAANHATRKDYVDNRRYPSVRTVATTTYTLAQTDEPQLVQFTAGTAVTFTIPTNATVNWPVGATVDFYQSGAGKVTVAPAGGVTIQGTPSLGLRAQYSAATLVKVATDTWLLMGDLG